MDKIIQEAELQGHFENYSLLAFQDIAIGFFIFLKIMLKLHTALLL